MYLKLIINTLILTLGISNTIAQKTMSLEKAIALCLENNYDIQISKQNENIARNNAGILNSGYLPSIGVSAEGNYSLIDNRVSLTDGQVFDIENINTVSYSSSINLNYTLFDGMGRKYNYQKFKEQHLLSELQTKFLIENTLLQVYDSYYNLAQNYENLQILKENLKISSLRVQRAKYGLDYGQHSKLEVFNAQIDYNTDSINVLSAALQVKNGTKSLNQLIGISIYEEYLIETDLSFTNKYILQDMQTKALENNSRLNQLEKDILINTLDIKIAHSSWLPQLRVSGRYSFNNNNNDANSGFNSPLAPNFNNSLGASAQLSLTWNIFDGGRAITQIQNAKINNTTSATRLTTEQKQLEHDINLAWHNLDFTHNLIQLQEENLIINETNFLRTEESYKRGQINSIEFRQAQLNLLNASNTLNNSKFNAKKIEMELLFLSGAIK